MPIFTDILSNTRTGIDKPGDMNAHEWYREKAQQVKSISPGKIITDNAHYNRTTIKPGFMYLFGYDPKLKNELPYYDRFPLIFPFKSDTDGFLAMNLHYIAPNFRAKLMDNLYPLVTNLKFDETTRIKASYNLLNSVAKYKYFHPCVKKYLYGHLKTKFLLIPANEWDIALFLPLQRFQKASVNQVYKDSRAMINGLQH
jgi:hypothetical protein